MSFSSSNPNVAPVNSFKIKNEMETLLTKVLNDLYNQGIKSDGDVLGEADLAAIEFRRQKALDWISEFAKKTQNAVNTILAIKTPTEDSVGAILLELGNEFEQWRKKELYPLADVLNIDRSFNSDFREQCDISSLFEKALESVVKKVDAEKMKTQTTASASSSQSSATNTAANLASSSSTVAANSALKAELSVSQRFIASHKPGDYALLFEMEDDPSKTERRAFRDMLEKSFNEKQSWPAVLAILNDEDLLSLKIAYNALGKDKQTIRVALSEELKLRYPRPAIETANNSSSPDVVAQSANIISSTAIAATSLSIPLASAKHVEPLNESLNALLKQIIPSDLFKVKYIGEISVANNDRDLFISNIRNSALTDALYQSLKVDDHQPRGHRAKDSRHGSYTIRRSDPGELAEKLKSLSPAEKVAMSHEIAELFIEKSRERAFTLVNKLTVKIANNRLENTDIPIQMRSLQESLQTKPPKTLEDVFTLNKNLTKLVDSYEQFMKNKDANKTQSSSYQNQKTKP
jgi:hypothetical protein